MKVCISGKPKLEKSSNYKKVDALKNLNTISGLFILAILCFVTYKTGDGFYAVLSCLTAFYLLHKAGLMVSAWLNKMEENEREINTQSSPQDQATPVKNQP